MVVGASKAHRMAEAARLYMSGMSAEKAAKACGLSKTYVRGYLQFTNQKRPPLRKRCSRLPDPTPEQIEAMATAIRESWTAAERARRYVGNGARRDRTQVVWSALRRSVRGDD